MGIRMTNPVLHFHKNELLDVLGAFTNGLADYYLDYVDNSHNETDLVNVIHSVFTTLDIHRNAIMEAITSEIVRYMNYYGVQPRDGVDEYKLIYFTGMRLAGFLARDGHELASKVVMYAAVILLDERLKKFVGDEGRPQLKQRLLKLIRDGKVEDKLGTDGIYLTYKCISNVMKDHNSKLSAQ